MSTKVTAIRDNLVSLVAGALDAEYLRIPNPYSAGDNNQLILNRGYGVAIGGAQRVDMELCKMAMERTFNIVLVRVAAASEHDVTTRDAIEIGLLEDVQSIRNDIELDSTLSGQAIRTDYVGDSGIEFLINQDSGFKYFSISISVAVTYQEAIGG